MANLLSLTKELLLGAGAPGRVVSRKSSNKLTDYQLIKLESEIGRTLFGETPNHKNREFFCLDADTWVWYEQWRDEDNVSKSRTIRYEVHPKGILKVEDSGKSYHFLKGQELENLVLATTLYYERVKDELYSQDLIAA